MGDLLPMSHELPCGRGMPRWSAGKQIDALTCMPIAHSDRAGIVGVGSGEAVVHRGDVDHVVETFARDGYAGEIQRPSVDRPIDCASKEFAKLRHGNVGRMQNRFAEGRARATGVVVLRQDCRRGAVATDMVTEVSSAVNGVLNSKMARPRDKILWCMWAIFSPKMCRRCR